MSSLLNIGNNALLAFQRALDTTGHNIANVNTDGYSRQRVEFASRPPALSRSDNIGSGVAVSGVERLTDNYLYTQSLTQGSEFARQDRFHTLAARVDALLSDPTTGVADSLNRYFEAARGVEAEPTSSAARRSLLGAAEQLTTRFNGVNQQFEELNKELNTRLGQLSKEVNTLSGEIAKLNLEIPKAQAATRQTPNDLLDRRDRLVEQLSEKIGITAANQANGSVNVYTANGQALVVGRTVTELTTQANAYDPSRVELAVKRTTGNVVLSDVASGGDIGGVLDFRREVLDPARSEMGRIAISLGESVNQQHQSGTDLYGNAGGAFFSSPSAVVLNHSANTGSAAFSTQFSDLGALSGDNYLLSYDGTSYQAVNQQTGNSVTVSGAGTTASPLSFDGLSITVSGTPAAGDRFMLQPTVAGARDLKSQITDPSRIAAAGPVQTSANLANTGTAEISSASVTDRQNANLRSGSTIQFNSPTSYSVNGGAAQAYTSGNAISVNGVEVRISGTPATGDQFQLQVTGANSSDNGNMASLADLQTRGVLDSGNVTVGAAYAAVVSGTGSLTQQAELQRDATDAFRNQIREQRLSVSGVNLDEEAANLLKFQQSYQAAAQVITAANDMFNTLLSAVRR